MAEVAPAIATNNCVVCKPAETTPLSALALADILYEAGLPPEMFQVVTGDPREIERGRGHEPSVGGAHRRAMRSTQDHLRLRQAAHAPARSVPAHASATRSPSTSTASGCSYTACPSLSRTWSSPAFSSNSAASASVCRPAR